MTLTSDSSLHLFLEKIMLNILLIQCFIRVSNKLLCAYAREGRLKKIALCLSTGHWEP